MADFNNGYTERNSQNYQRDLVLATNEYCFLQSKTNGVIKTYSGPITMTISAQEALVVFDEKTKQFVETNNFEKAKKLYVSAPENWYISLKNPAPDNVHPEVGKPSMSPELVIGKKIHIKGPASFSLFPGQMAKVIKGHTLRSNQYLLAKVYDEIAAQKTAPEGVKYYAGQMLVIKGTETPFYIPPTGIEVVAREDNPYEYVRDAVTLERLEYCILKDENGSKEYFRGPSVVFPTPTQTFVETEKGGVIFRALELSHISGIYIKVIAEYTENGVTHPVGEELFITGKDQMIYYPRPEHAMIQYDGKYMHHAIAIPKGEGRYILDRLIGTIKMVEGPTMYLPDPRTEVVVKRKLTKKECQLLYPGNDEVLKYNMELNEKMVERQAKGTITDSLGNTYATANQEKTLAIFEANANISRGTSYTKPRTITLDNKYDGVVAVNVWTGYAINVVSKSGEREVVVGPATKLLQYDETLEALTLSTGKPKTTDRPLTTAYLRVDNNLVTDIVTVKTKDYVDVTLKLSYRVDFLEEYKDKWFSVDNYVKFLCDKERSRLKKEAMNYNIEEFYSKAADIVRNTVLATEDKAKDNTRSGYLFKENGMLVYDVEVLNVAVEDSVAEILERHQETMVRNALNLSDAEKRVKMEQELAEYERKEAQIKYETDMKELELKQAIQLEKMTNDAAIAEKKRAEDEAKALAEQNMQPILDAIQKAKLDRNKEVDAARIETETRLAEIEKAKQAAYAETVATIMQSISPDLTAALSAKANADIMNGLGNAISPYALAKDGNIADAINTILRGTSLEKTFKNIEAAKAKIETK
jgi:major vault protein